MNRTSTIRATSDSLDDRGLPVGYRFIPDMEITPRQVRDMMDRGEHFVHIDCRLPAEYQITHIEGARLVPLQKIEEYLENLHEHLHDKIVVHCRSGWRSLQFVQTLKRLGFADVKSMAGGILLWNRDINPGAPQY